MKFLFVIIFATVLIQPAFAGTDSSVQKYVPTKYFDLIHTDLKLQPIWENHQLKGEAVLSLVPHFYSQSKITLDAKSFNLSKVACIQGKKILPLNYDYDRRKLTIQLGKTYHRKDTLRLVIHYIANPDSVVTFAGKAISDEKGMYFINTNQEKKGVDMHLWTQGETEANSAWFPTLDHPSQKHSQRIAVTCDKNLVSLANGKMTSTKQNPDGTKTDVWEQKLPHSVYLSVLVIGNFKIVKDKWRNKEVSYYMEPKYESMARPIFGRTPEMIAFFSKKLGVDFPWDKYSQVIVHDFVSGAMENTSAVTFNTMFQKDMRELVDDNDDETIAHELFHHWFGDLCTCKDWAHLTLNESFANYSEYLWHEYKYGMDEAQAYWYRDLGGYMASSSRKRESLIRYDYGKPDDMFDVITYQKGGKILHMLRKYIGDEAFFAGLKLYLTRFAYKTAEYHDLRAVMEEITGEDLRWFFDQWYLKGGHPTLTTSYLVKNDTITLHLVQKHNFDTGFIYRLPLDVKILSDSGISSSRILFNKRKDSFQFIAKGFQGIIPDGENALVGYKAETKTIDEWIFILKNSDQYLDQATAMRKLGQKKSKEEVRDAVYESLSSDKPRIRGLAIDLIDEEWLSKSPKWNKKLIEIAENDKRGANRADAIEKLGANKSLEDYKELFIKAMEDSSYLVEENAFRIYAKIDSAGALERAKKMIFSNSYNILGASFSIISKTKDTTLLPLFSQAIDHASGYKLLAIYSHLGRFVTTMSDEVYLPRVESFKKLASSSKETEKFSGKYALNALNTELKKLDDETSKKRQKEVDDFLTDLNKKDKDED